MRIGIAQMNTVPGAFDQTVERMVAQAERAAEQKVDLLVFPLAALFGIELPGLSDRPSFLRDAAEALASALHQLPCACLVPILVDDGSEAGSFDAVLIEDGTARPLVGVQGPSPLSGGLAGPSPDEHEVTQFSCGGMRFALALSYADLDALDDFDYHVDATIFLSGYPFALDDPSSAMGTNLEDGRFAGDAETMGSWLIGVAPVGGYGIEVFTGGSFVLAPSGALIASAPAFEEALVVAQVGDPALAEEMGASLPGGSSRPEVYDETFHLWQAVSLGIHDHVTKNGYTDVALCLDGTLASSVLVALASDALGPLHVHALVGASAGAQAPACRALARRLRVDRSDAPGALGGFDVHDVDELALAELARTHGALVLSSADKTELALALKPGRLRCADLCPLGDVYRSDVLEMAHVRNTISPLFGRVGLSEHDAIELTMPDGGVRRWGNERTLATIDEVLLGFLECDRPFAELVASKTADEELVRAVLRSYRATEALRIATAPALVMSTHTLDDVRFPLGSSWHDEHLERIVDWLVPPVPPMTEKPSEPEAVEEQRDRHVEEPDIAATLSMLRDLAEQGGFVPGELIPIDVAEGMQPQQLPEGLRADQLGWVSPFSEN